VCSEISSATPTSSQTKEKYSLKNYFNKLGQLAHLNLTKEYKKAYININVVK
jgi:hypothetical protein